MPRTFVRQDTQIRQSDVYDATAAAGATMESGAANIEDDLNNLRAQIKRILNDAAGNWYDDVPTINTKKRDLTDLNTDLDDMEEKRIIGGVEVLENLTTTAAVAASSTLTSTANPNNGDQVVIGPKTYTFQTTLTDVDGNVAIGGSQAQAMENLRRAINLDGVAGTNYALSMTANAGGVSATNTTTTVVVSAVEKGSHKDSLATTETSAAMSWTGATLGAGTGGAGNQITLIVSGNEAPSVAAAVGAGTALGAVVATLAGDVGSHDLAEVSSTNPSVPKNRCLVRDAQLHEGIMDGSGRQIYALLQAENGVVDGDLFNDTTKQVQLSFVVVDDSATSADLIPADAAYTGGKTLEYVYPRRYSLDTMPEDIGFPHFTFTDGSASVSVTLNNAIDNQGVTPATQDTNIDWDLGAAKELAWRDALAADLLRIIEGSGGGTTKVQVHSDVDFFDVDAVDNDFANGATFDSSGTAINVGETAGQIDSAGALKILSGGGADLTLESVLEMIFDDINKSTSTYAGSFKLSETPAEWDTFETNFGEVSLLNALNQAFEVAGGITKVYATKASGGVIAADTDVSGPSNDNNIDADLGDLSGGSFVDDYDIFLNGQLLRSGANAAANHDVYPGTSLANGQLKFEFKLKQNDVIAVIKRA